jgi:hypothetical protein
MNVPEPRTLRPNSRQYFTIALLVTATLFVIILAWVAYQFIRPQQDLVKIGLLDDFPPSSQPYIAELKLKHETVFVVNQGGSLLVFNRNTPVHNRCIYNWVVQENRFIDPCSGTQYLLDGAYEKGPGLQDLNQYGVVVDGDNEVFVNLDEVIPGEPHP